MNIYVGNLPYQANDQDLEELFAKHGSVTSARVIMDKSTGQSKGFGFVEMPNQGEALDAIKAIGGSDFMGRNLRVNESQPKPQGGGGGYRGGAAWLQLPSFLGSLERSWFLTSQGLKAALYWVQLGPPLTPSTQKLALAW